MGLAVWWIGTFAFLFAMLPVALVDNNSNIASGLGSGNINKIVDEEGSGSESQSSILLSSTLTPYPTPSPPAGSYIVKILVNFTENVNTDDFINYIELKLAEANISTDNLLKIEMTDLQLLIYFEDSKDRANNSMTEIVASYLRTILTEIQREFPQFLNLKTIYVQIMTTTLLPIPTDTTIPLPTTTTSIFVILWVMVSIAGVLIILIAISCTGFIILLCKKRQRKKKENEDDDRKSKESKQAKTKTTEMNEIYMVPLPRPNRLSCVSLVSKGHLSLEGFTKPLTVPQLGEWLKYPAKLHEEYMSIPANMTSMSEIPPGAQDKNRYSDVLPNPNSRVVLFLKFGVQNSDYINANYVRGFRGQTKAFIATQGPLSYTVEDFWRLVWEQRVTVIVMMTNLIERNMVKCDQYWPDTQNPTDIYGDIQVTIRKRVTHGNYILTTFFLQHLQRLVNREVHHYWYTKWPDMGTPQDPQEMVDFLLETRKNRESFTMPGPTIVHCSAGIGRTGVFIAADTGMKELEEMQCVDILRIVSNLRQDRGGMVQTKDQYVFLHKVLYEYARRMGYVIPNILDMAESSDEDDSDTDGSMSLPKTFF